MEFNNTEIRPKEIDILQILRTIWKQKKIIIYCVATTVFIGLAIALTTPKQYKVVTVMLPQGDEGKSMSGFSSLAAIAGFDLDFGSGGVDISPVIYPQIIESESFMLQIMHTKYSFKEFKEPVSMYDYFVKLSKPSFLDNVKAYTIGLPALIKKQFSSASVSSNKSSRNDGLTHMNEDEINIYLMLKSNLTLSLNKKEGVLTLTSIFNESKVAAQVAQVAQELLQKTITDIKTKRAIEQLNFIQRQYDIKKAEYVLASRKLASYKDRNMFVATAIGSNEESRLNNDYTIAFNVYSELAKQLESAKIKVKQTTPLFITIKPIVVPLQPFAPRKSIILASSVFVGIIIGCIIIFLKNVFPNLTTFKQRISK